MPFEIVSTADESSFLDDQISEILSSDNVPLPPFDQRVGHVDVRWEDVGSQRAWLQTRGGTPEDQLLARSVVGAQLASCGFREATRDWGMEKTADWSAIQAKAKRLMQSGAVQVLRNGYENIVAQVQGDHGTYQSEIFRQDPTSRAISGSDCECGWGEFQNQPRTRQWKKFQDRPCAHILAAFWQAQSMPLDEDANPANPQGGQPGPQTFGPDATQGFDPAQRSFGPNDASPFGPPSGSPPGPDPGAQGGGEAPPGPSPADVLPQYPMAQMPQPPPQNMTSIPGATPPTPTNPVQYPAGPGGTFSSVQNPWDVWHMSGLDDSTDASPNADTPTSPNPVYRNGDLVQLRYPDTGTLVGRSEEHGAGQPTDLQPGMVGEVLGTHPTTGMHNVLWAGKAFSQNKEFEPWGSVGWHFPSYLLPRPDMKKPGPAIRRVRPDPRR
jgi:hypothetical protein